MLGNQMGPEGARVDGRASRNPEHQVQSDIHLFEKPSDPASVCILSSNWHAKDYGATEGPKDLELNCTPEEESVFWSIVDNPPCFEAEVISRQQVMDVLVDPALDFDAINSARRAAYSLGGCSKALIPEPHARHDDRGILTLAEKYSVDDLDKAREAFRHPEAEAGRKYLQDHDLRCLIELESAIPAIQTYAALLKEFDDPFISASGSAIEEKAKGLSAVDIGKILLEGKEGSFKLLLKHLEEAEAMSPTLASIGAVIAFAHLARRTGMARATFNENEPESYEGAWNLLKEKCASGWSWNEGETDQILADSMPDRDLSLFVGPNMSGKSFAMWRELYLRMCAQSFGYAPAGKANLHIRDSFALLDRPSTESINNLSAFGSEVEKWLKIFASLRNRALVLADESFSTTSPGDQYRLIAAVVRYLRKRGAKLFLASHSEDYSRAVSLDPSANVYHFETAIKEKGDIDFKFTLQEGLDEPKALLVAAKLGLPQSVIERARKYKAGERPPISPPALPQRQITRYTEAERESLKAQKRSFRCFLPETDELVLAEKWGGKRALSWRLKDEQRNARFALYDDEDEPGEERNIKDYFLQLLSFDGDFGYRFTWGEIGGVHHDNALQTIQMLLMGGGRPDSRDVLERQNFFRQLADPELRERLTDLIRKTWENIILPLGLQPDIFENFNSVMFDQAYETVAEKYSLAIKKHDLAFFAAAVELNGRLCGFDPAELGVRDLLDRVRLLVDYEAESNKHRDFDKATPEGKAEAEAYSEQRRRDFEEMCEKTGFTREEMLKSFGTREFALKLLKEVHKKIEPLIRPVSFWEIEGNAAREAIAPMAPAIQASKEEAVFILPPGVDIANRLLALTDSNSYAAELVSTLRSIDSVQSHQLANYFEEIFEAAFSGRSSGNDLLQAMRKLRKGKDSNSRIGDLLGDIRRSEPEKLLDELLKLYGITSFGQVIEEAGLCEVSFSEDPALEIVNAWNLIEDKDKQVANSSMYGADSRVHLITGTNMSGKTHDEKAQVWCLLSGMSTGFAPAESMKVPMFDGVVYLDRVSMGLDKALSSFGNEVEFWKKLLYFAETGRFVFLGIDEAFSTTSASYQEALCYAVCAELVERGHYVCFASHNHRFIEQFLQHNPGFTKSFHFATHIEEEGGIGFDYRKESGHALSNAILVAKKLGMPEEITSFAELMEVA